ncbi:MAG: hypothetical protein M1812_007340 [Candelaria pacifica]|nr:MAG: hypothetical protein M1812_007340 [Candelaria pacifica]
MSLPGTTGPPPKAPSAAVLVATPGIIDCQGWNLMPFGQHASVSPALLEHLPSPCRPVPLRPGATVSASQIEAGRPSYILGLLIQSRGEDAPSPCHHRCRRDLGVFAGCRRIPGIQHGACGNCVWQSRALHCVHADGFVGHEPTATLGKRKRLAKSVSETTADSSSKPGPEPELDEDEDEDPSTIFRRHFEAQFAPLETSLIKAKTLQAASQTQPSQSDSSSFSDWEGISDTEESPNIKIEIIDLTTDITTRRTASKEDFKHFMVQITSPPSPSPPLCTNQPNQPLTPNTHQTPKPPSKSPNPPPPNKLNHLETSDPTTTTNLQKDLQLQRLLSETHLLHPSTTRTLTPTGPNRHKANDLRLQTLGSHSSILTQLKMPLLHRKGILSARENREEARRREAKENGIILEKKIHSKNKNNNNKEGIGIGIGIGSNNNGERRKNLKRERNIGAPLIGKFKGGTLRLSQRDVANIEGSRSRKMEGNGMGKGNRRR